VEGLGEGTQQAYGVGAVEQVVMTSLEGGLYKDAVRFSNGTEVLLQKLDRGLTAVIVGFAEKPSEAADVDVTPAVPEYV